MSTRQKKDYIAVRHKFWVIAICVFTIGFLSIGLKSLKKDTGIDSILPKGNPEYKYYKKVEKTFGSMRSAVIGVHHDSTIFNKEVFAVLYDLNIYLKNMKQIESQDDILSLISADNIDSYKDELIIKPFFEWDGKKEITSKNLADVKNKVESNPLIKGRLVSDDLKNTAVVASFPSSLYDDDSELQIVAKSLENKIKILNKKYPDVKLYLSGIMMADAKTASYMDRDLAKLFPVALLLVWLIMLISFRDIRVVFIPLLITVLSILASYGLKGLIGSALTISETSIPIMLIAICCADGVHVVSEFLNCWRKGVSKNEAISITMKKLKTPVILTSITTSFAFISLLSAPSVSIKNMGIYLSFGVIAAMLLSLYLVPALLSLLPKYCSKKSITKKNLSSVLFSNKAADFITKNSIFFTSMLFIIIIFSIIGIVGIKVESDLIRFFHPKDEFRVNTNFINDNLGGVSEIYVTINSEKNNEIKNPEVLNSIWELQKYAETLDGVSYTYSLADYVRYMYFLINQKKPSFLRLPNVKENIVIKRDSEIIRREIDGKDQIENIMMLYEMAGGDNLNKLVSPGYNKICIHVRIDKTKNEVVKEVLRKIKDKGDQLFESDIKVKFSNYSVIITNSKLIVQSQIISLISSIFSIFIILSIIYRNPIHSFIVMIPTFCAVFFNFGVMYLFDVALDTGTAIIASIGLGVGIDYSIHYFSSFRAMLISGVKYKDAIKDAISANIRGIGTSSLAVGLGFSVLCLSLFKIVFNIGWITGLSMITTAIGALVFLPAILWVLPEKMINNFPKKD